MKSAEVIKKILSYIPPSTFIISSSGRVSRELYFLGDRSENFYTFGAEGVGSSIAIGVAKKIPDKKVIYIEEASTTLINLSALSLYEKYILGNFVHVILDDGMNKFMDLSSFLRNVSEVQGFRYMTSFSKFHNFKSVFTSSAGNYGAIIFRVRIEPSDEDVIDIPLSPAEIVNRFSNRIMEVTHGCVEYRGQ